MEDKKIVKAEGSPAVIIEHAIKSGATMEQLEKFMILKERYEVNEAKKAYHVAMSAFKANPPQIIKDKAVSFGAGKTSYKHASLSNVTKCISEALSKQGLSASWITKQNGQIGVTCKITHILGHSEETTLFAGADTSGSKNSIQAIGSTVTYLQRYTLLSLTGLATADQDDDGAKSVDVETIDDKQLSTIRDFIDNKNVDKEKFLKYMGIESVEDMPKSEYNKAIKGLEAKE